MRWLINDAVAMLHGFLMLTTISTLHDELFCLFEVEWFYVLGFFVVIQNFTLLLPHMLVGRCILSVIVRAINAKDINILLRAYPEKWILLIPLWVLVWNIIFWIVILYIIITY